MHIRSFLPIKAICFLCFVCFCSELLGQIRTTDTLFVQRAVEHVKESYYNSIGVESHLYNGVQYRERNLQLTDKGIPFFITEDWTDGTICYDNEIHQNVPILYDVVRDKVVIEHKYSASKLELSGDKVKYFIIRGHRFVRLDGDVLRNSSLSPGFYDLLHDGNTKFYAKWKKNYTEVIVAPDVLVEYIDVNHFYIYKEGSYFSVRGKASVLNVLKDRKTELRKYIRKNKLQFKTDRESAIASVVSYYDELKK